MKNENESFKNTGKIIGQKCRHIIPGILLCFALAVPSWFLGKGLPIIGGPVFAIVIGIVLSLIFPKLKVFRFGEGPGFEKGIKYTSKKLLQYSIILLGFEMNFNNIIIDPGFGFAKTTEQNYELLKKLSIFCTFEKPILVGMSRKSMLWKTLETSPQDALNATTVVNTIALMNGAQILRVHDVKEAVETVRIFQYYKKQ